MLAYRSRTVPNSPRKATARQRPVRWTALLALLAVPLLALAFSSGPPSGYTGGFNEPNCTACHASFPVNSGPGSVSVAVPLTYESGVTYAITVTVSDPDQMRWGFELSARTEAGAQAGNLVAGADGFTQRLANIGNIQYISHTSTGTRLGTLNGVNFDFPWTAPDVSAGPVVFSVAGNAANGNLANTGDRIYTNAATSQPQAPPPTISLEPTSVSFTATAAGPNPAAKEILISNSAGGPMIWTAEAATTSGGAWLSASPESGSAPNVLTVVASIGGLAAGDYSGSVTVEATGATNTPQVVPVTLHLDPARRRRGQLVSD